MISKIIGKTRNKFESYKILKLSFYIGFCRGGSSPAANLKFLISRWKTRLQNAFWHSFHLFLCFRCMQNKLELVPRP